MVTALQIPSPWKLNKIHLSDHVALEVWEVVTLWQFYFFYDNWPGYIFCILEDQFKRFLFSYKINHFIQVSKFIFRVDNSHNSSKFLTMFILQSRYVFVIFWIQLVAFYILLSLSKNQIDLPWGFTSQFLLMIPTLSFFSVLAPRHFPFYQAKQHIIFYCWYFHMI